MLNIIKAIILGIVQGITEWLPISSTAHLILVEDILSFNNVSESFFDVFKVVIQLGSILAVIVLYFKKLFPYKKKDNQNYGKGIIKDVGLFFKNMGNDTKTWVLWAKIAVACIPAAVAGYFLDDIVDGVLSSEYVIAAALIIYGIAFLWLENTKHSIKCSDIDKMSFSRAFFIGCFQALALIPGTSRSGSTILGATVLGTSRAVAAEFSFFLAVPIMFGASFLKLVRLASGFAFAEWLLILVGSFIAFVVSLAAIKLFINYLKKHSFAVFGWYRIILGIIILLVMTGKNIF